jgi:hypothetical protein
MADVSASTALRAVVRVHGLVVEQEVPEPDGET